MVRLIGILVSQCLGEFPIIFSGFSFCLFLFFLEEHLILLTEMRNLQIIKKEDVTMTTRHDVMQKLNYCLMQVCKSCHFIGQHNTQVVASPLLLLQMSMNMLSKFTQYKP